MMLIFWLVISALLTFALLYFIVKEFQEISFLKKILKKINGKTEIESGKDLINIKNFLNSTISHRQELKTETRPLLRHTATQILTSKYGFCGENARVAIKLFLLGGMKARRIYLFRKEWEHVLIEHEFKDIWYMFDGHFDEYTVLNDQDVAKIPSEKIDLYPDNYANNPYIDYCRIKFFYKTPFFKFLSKMKLQAFLVYISESPYLIKASFLFILLLLEGVILSYYL